MQESCGEDYNDRKHRVNCYQVVPCAPAQACEGNNVCGVGYTGKKCNSCCDALHKFVYNQYGNKIPNPECYDDEGNQRKFFRQYGECAPCPSNPWMIVAILLCGLSFMGSMAYVMKKKHMSLGILSIAVDYFQILSLLSSVRPTPWPQIVLDLYTWLSAFNFNINITAPECVFEVAYEDKWRMIMMMPCFMIGVVFVYNWGYAFAKKFFFNQNGKKLYSHSHQAVGVALTIMYYIYLNLSMTALEIFNCGTQELEDPRTGEIVSDGKQYMAATNWVCYEEGSLQVFLIPYAVLALCLYTLGFPLFCGLFLFNKENAKKAREDQLLRAMNLGYDKKTNPNCYEFRKRYHRLYYYYKPDKWYWMLIVLGRKFLVATVSLLFRGDSTFQMCMVVLVIFIANTIQVRNQPFMSMSEREDVLEGHKDAADSYRAEMERRRGYSDSHKKKQIKNMSDIDGDELRKIAGNKTLQYFWNYNSVETILLGCAIMVNLFGIMFESAFLKRGSTAYETLATLTIVVIVGSLVYLFLVLWSEIVVAVFPKMNCAFVDVMRSTTRIGKNGRDLDLKNEGLDDLTKLDRDSLHLEMKNLTYAENPMFGKGEEDGKSKQKSDDELKNIFNHPEYLSLQNKNKGLRKDMGAVKADMAKKERERERERERKDLKEKEKEKGGGGGGGGGGGAKKKIRLVVKARNEDNEKNL